MTYLWMFRPLMFSKSAITASNFAKNISPVCFQPVLIFKLSFFPYSPYHSIFTKKEFNQVDASRLYKDELNIQMMNHGKSANGWTDFPLQNFNSKPPHLIVYRKTIIISPAAIE